MRPKNNGRKFVQIQQYCFVESFDGIQRAVFLSTGPVINHEADGIKEDIRVLEINADGLGK